MIDRSAPGVNNLDSRLLAVLSQVEEELWRLVHRKAGRILLNCESGSDLVQGILLEAIRQAKNFSYRDDAATRSWILELARGHLSSRRAYWKSLKRDSANVVRLNRQDQGNRTFRFDPPDSATGPSSHAARREQLVLAAKAVDRLLPRDRDIVRRSTEGETIREIADGLGLSYEAAERARLRAFDRLRAAYKLVCQGAQ